MSKRVEINDEFVSTAKTVDVYVMWVEGMTADKVEQEITNGNFEYEHSPSRFEEDQVGYKLLSIAGNDATGTVWK